MKKFTLLLCLMLLFQHLTLTALGSCLRSTMQWQTADEWQTVTDSADILGTPVQVKENTKILPAKKGSSAEKMMIGGCDLDNYESAILVAPADFPYTSLGSGITVEATSNTPTLTNMTYTCGGNSFSTSSTAWWINATDHIITLTFSEPVTNFSVVVNGTNDNEIFTFNANTGTISLSNFCTAGFNVIGAGNQLEAIASGTYGTLITVNNPTGSTVYTITHNGVSAGSRITLLDCYDSEITVYADPVDNVVACGGDMIPTISFTGTPDATFNWTNNNTAIGLAANGTGNITGFTAANVSSQQVATITVTPVLGAESGTPVTFTITVKPEPTLTLGTITNPASCGGSNGSIAFTTTNLPNGIYNLSYSGAGSPQNVTVTGNAFVLSGLIAGSYSNFSITNNGCTGTVAGPVSLQDPSYTWYRDMDGDGFGNPSNTTQSCSQPPGFVGNNADCDDNDALEHPGQTWYADLDNDGYSSGVTQVSCLRPAGHKVAVELAAATVDCNDNDEDINPAATEVCDGIDNDCDGMTDEGVLTTYYRDMDGDGFGNPTNTTQACSLPSGYVTDNTDCDDSDPLEKPGQTWYADLDNDGYSSGVTQVSCLRPAGHKVSGELAAATVDCNDNDEEINPAVTEVCDNIDNNCNGMTDEGELITYYRDMDGDGFGNPTNTTQACSQPSGYVTNNTDCDDNDALEHPGQTWYADLDDDGYSSGVTQVSCLRPAGHKVAVELASTTVDCNDNDEDINPAATEVCDGIDNDCNGMTDEGVLTTYYRDMDGDGFGNPTNTTQACSQPSGYVTDNTDCDDNDALEHPGQTWYADLDNDGYSSGVTQVSCLRPSGHKVAVELASTTVDCNDNDEDINPAATEVCDGIDNDCNGMTDEGVLTTYYRDMDGDGFGNPTNTTQACSQPSGYVTDNTDCDDNDALEYPGQTWYADLDNDGYSSGATQVSCLRPSGHKVAVELASTTVDCNDNDEDINPAATEVCDGIDNDCNGMTDEGVLTTYYRDMDGDGFGNPTNTTQACSQPSGYVTDNTDCDDNDALEYPGQTWYADLDNDGYSSGVTQVSCLRPAGHKVAVELASTTVDCNDNDEDINPAATEVCDGIDNDCNGMTDEGVLTTYYRDMDGDGFGNPTNTTQACSQPSGYVTDNTDCDDNDALEHPGQTWYADLDDDGYSSGVTQVSCLRPAGHKVSVELASTTVDCNDNDEDINPAATEVCDGIDNNCNGMTDEGVLTTYYRDMDGDGFGNPTNTTQACSLPSGYVTNNTDCDDNDALEYPGQTWYADLDNDGYSSGVTQVSCLRPAGHKVAVELASTTVDCNDNDEDINPAATEVCDGIDNNCNGMTDEGVLTTYYRDMDGDGFGNPTNTTQACSLPSGYVTNNTDCDDNDALEKPGQTWYADLDDDGYSSGVTQVSCLRPAGHKAAVELASTTVDCNDNDEDINPAATEVCDGIDNDCNGMTDEGVLTTYYRDMDGDGFGNPTNTTQACSLPSGYVANNTDCDDNDALEYPGQTWYADLDNDGYSSGVTQVSCLRPAGHKVAVELAAATVDCNDNNEDINPAATEVCDNIDNDCNGMTDEGVLTTYYRDMDGDGFGNPTNTTQACSLPSGYVANNTDCDDNDALEYPGQTWYADLDNDGYSSGATQVSCLRPAGHKVAVELASTTVDCNDNDEDINPAATEVCDGIDNDCNGMTDEGVLTTYYRDMDGDGFGNPTNTTQACSLPSGYVTDNTDCDDNDALEYPGQTWYADLDNDGYSSGATQVSCLRPAGHKVAVELASTTVDCNDNNPAIKPGATEVCDGEDNDCDGLLDADDPNYIDNTPPEPVCLNTTVYVNDGGVTVILPEDVLDFQNSFDNCGPVSVYAISPAEITCEQLGQTIPVNVTASDGKGNKTDCIAQVTVEQGTDLPTGWSASDIGTTANGSSSYMPCTNNGTFTLSAQGYTTNTTDVQHAVYQSMCGNTEIIAHVLNITPTGGWAGIQMRETTSQGSKKFTLKTQLSTVLRREIRNATFGTTNTLQSVIPPNHAWLRLVRTGKCLQRLQLS